MAKEAKLIFGVFLVMTLQALFNTVDCEPVISDLAIDIDTKEETETDFFTVEQHTWVTRRKRVSDDITAYVDFPVSMDFTFNFIDKDVKLRLKRNEYMTTNVRLTDESGPIQHDLQRKTAIYSDLEKQASFVIRCEGDRDDCTMHGAMERDGKMWTISPDPLQPMLHKAVKSKKDRRILFGSDTPPIPGVQTVEKHTNEKVTEVNWSRPNPRFITSRHKRAIPTNCSIVECMAIADESVWTFFMNITGSNVTAAEEELTQYYMELYAQADLHYDKVSVRTQDTCLRLFLAAVHIQKTRSESWSAPAEFPQQAARPYVNAVTGMLRCGVQGNAFRQTYSLDLYQCFTRKDLLWNENGGTMYYAYHRGLSFMSTACQVNRYPYASSVIESYGDKVELLIAREIAHALGADHDSKSGCDDDDGYIMANEVAVNEDKLKLKNIWYFSTCTLTQIVLHLLTQPPCLTTNGFNATAYDAFKTAPLAGTTTSWSEQCVLKFEVGSAKCDPTGQNRTYIAQMCESNIYCTAPNGTCTAAGRPYDGTPCGDLDAYCSYGECYIPPRQLGVVCSCHADCSDSNSTCNVITGVCECREGFYDDNGTNSIGGACQPKVLVGALCPQNDACIDPNAFCDSGRCACLTGYYNESDACALLKYAGENCTASYQCNGENVECSGSPSTCRCPSDRYLEDSSGNCVPKLDLGSNCTDGQCGPANSVCDSTTTNCECQDGFFDTNGTSAGGDCSAKVALYAACSQPDSCSDQNAVCSTTCNCSSDYFDNNGTCQPLRCVGETCSAASDCRAQNVECTGTPLTCRCPTDRYLDLSSGNCVAKLDLGSNCTDGQCGPANSVCDSTTTNCECQDGFFDTNGTSAGGDCSAKVALYAACSQPDSCSDQNAVCSTTCNCSSDYFDNNGTCQPLRCVGETCSAASDCRAQNVECTGTPLTCRCPADRYLDLSSGNCVAKLDLGSNCTDGQCGPANSVCDSTTTNCECQDGFFDTNGTSAGGDCSAKVALYAACSQPDSCSDQNAVCSTTCNCSSDYFDNNGTCQPLRCVGETCSAASDCRAQNVECTGTPLTCRCPADRYLDLSSGNCVAKLDLGSNCTDGQCGPANSVCDSTTTNCECQDGFFDTNGTSAGGDCSAKVALYAACSQPDSCSDQNAVCSTTCNCSSDYFDNNGTCQPLRCVGETCSAASDCRAQNVECTGTPLTCRCPADRYLDLSSGNCVAKLDLGSNCTDGQCGPANSVCDSTTTNCECQDGFFDTNGTSAGGDCSAKVALYAACSQPDSCSDQNAVCSTTCNCSSDYFDNNGTCQPLRCVGETCSAASDCRAQNVECTGTPLTCRCPADRYLDLSSGNCVAKLDLGSNCTDGQCGPANSVCDSTTTNCECQDGFFDTNGTSAGGDCSAKVALYAACSQPDSCSDQNAVCSTTCNCSSDYFDNNGTCQPLRCVGETCSAASDCRAQNVECTGMPLTCRCPADRYLDLSSGNCVAKLDLGSTCTDGQCGPANSVCDSTTTNCECQDGFFDTNGTSAGGDCSAKVALYAACSQPDSCSDPKAVCSSTCNCSSDYFDNNGTCQPLRCVGETCSAASDCRAQNVECTGTPLTCRCPADRYLDLSSGNCVAKKELNASCEIGQCKEFSVCYPTTSRCQCIDGYEVNGTMCSLGNVSARCPDNWVSYDGSCYLFADESLNFAAADNYCRQLDAYLVSMNTVEENVWVKSFCRKLVPTSYFIGLTDIETDGTWKWQDTNETTTVTDWYPGEPNGGTVENCAVLFKNFDYVWIDVRCSQTFKFICEQGSLG